MADRVKEPESKDVTATQAPRTAVEAQRNIDTIIKFYLYQKQWLHDDSRFKIGMFSRQSGKTFTTCAEIVMDCILHEIQGKRTRWVILSRGERQAKEAMDENIKPMIKAFYVLLQGLGRSQPDYNEYDWKAADNQEASYKALEVTFPSGSRITALPANPDTARGFSANVLLDEFAFHADSREIWKALFPVISKGGLKLRVVSTPNGKGNKFFELMTAGDGWEARGEDTPCPDEDGWSRHICDIHKAVDHGLDRDIEGLRKALMDEDAWAQEFLLQWMDSAHAWLDFDLINSCENPLAGKPELYEGGPCYFGNDIARVKDLWILWILEEVDGILWTRELIVRRNIKFAEQDAIMDDAVKRYNMYQLAMDQTGMGMKPVEDAQERYGEDRVEGVMFNVTTKQDMAIELKEAMNDRKIMLPAGDQELRDDLHKIKRLQSDSGVPRFIAESDSKGHADRFWGAGLGIRAAKSDYQPLDYIPVKPQEDALDRHIRVTAGFGASEGLM